MNIQIISLATEFNRRAHMSVEMKKHNIFSYEFFDAISSVDIKLTAEKLEIDLDNSELSNGEKGCLLSHISLWKKMVVENLDYLVILEDDIYLGQDADLFLSSSDWIPTGINFIKFEKFSNHISVEKESLDIKCNRQLFQLKKEHLGTAGYLINQSMAKKLLTYVGSLSFFKPVDQLIFNDFIVSQVEPVYQMVPGLSIQDFLLENKTTSLVSSIEQERIAAKKKRNLYEKSKRTFGEKILKEIFRPVFQLYLVLKPFFQGANTSNEVKMWFR
ncbi:glycosyltransferase family 25 protein [Acinetobacter sp. UBA6720]|uniref:glycosyltransferase family 25 protein n=1 Tax=Acinetobacter sp. UBA6720 TaxID=1945953 RepID=UPI0025BB1099|nr:glycosyltransferase family 25 protein [Acinetobacter sp. UBA6720]